MDSDIATAETQARRLEHVYEQLEIELRPPAVLQRLRQPASDNEWSAMQILGHLVEMIPYWLHHCRTLMVATGDPPPFGRTLDAPERLEGVERGAAAEPEELLGQLKREIRLAAEAIRAMSPTERAKQGLHIRRGAMTVAAVLEGFIVSHAEDHLAQVRQALRE